MRLFCELKNFSLPYKIGFVRGHYYLTNAQIGQIERMVGSDGGRDIVSEYENKFSGLIGDGFGISFASGRMSFFSLLKILNIGAGDEVILLGFTCSVMVNAVWMSGATPVFSDIDTGTFGSDFRDIEKKITSRTKVIVAQHSFGIPCDISGIIETAKKRGIFVVEDCAIALDSSIDGVSVGNWGDAAIFSTDHTKPLNTLIGGFFYTKNKPLYEKMKKFSENLPGLEIEHQKRLFAQILFERKHYTPERYPRAKYFGYIRDLGRKLSGRDMFVFLERDYNRETLPSRYPYPARMPYFLARVGLFELERWSREKELRISLLNSYIEAMKRSGLEKWLPKAYLSDRFKIVPLRFVFQSPDSDSLTKAMSDFIDINQFWFRRPIICSSDSLERLGYKIGTCPESEKACAYIVNWPAVVAEKWPERIVGIFRKIMLNK